MDERAQGGDDLDRNRAAFELGEVHGPGRRAADALRRLQAALVDPGWNDERLSDLAGALERVETELETRLPATRYPAEHVGPFMTTHPVIGPGNAVAPPLTLGSQEQTAVAKARYGPAHEGPPGAVQGGVIAAAFDIVLAYGAVLGGAMGFTGSLAVRFVQPTPIGEEVRYEARCEAVRGRKAKIGGRLVLAGGVTAATAEGIFVRARD